MINKSQFCAAKLTKIANYASGAFLKNRWKLWSWWRIMPKTIMLAQSIQATAQSFGPAGVTVICMIIPASWASPFPKPQWYGHPCNPNPNPYRQGNMKRGCPYHCKNTGKTAISVCAVILHCQKYHDLSWDTNNPCKLMSSIRPAGWFYQNRSRNR